MTLDIFLIKECYLIKLALKYGPFMQKIFMWASDIDNSLKNTFVGVGANRPHIY